MLYARARYICGNMTYIDILNWEIIDDDWVMTRIDRGFEQADTIVLQLTNMDRGKFVEAIDYMRRNNLLIKDIILMNRLGEIFELSRKWLLSGKYRHKIQGFL